MRYFSCLFAVFLLASPFSSPGFRISGLSRFGDVTWDNAFTNGVCTIMTAAQVNGPWLVEKNVFTTNSDGRDNIGLAPGNKYVRLALVDISSGPEGFTNLINSYGLLTTVAGKGQFNADGTNFWKAGFEGALATSVNLSRPHFAMEDDAGNLYIVDKDSHSLLKVGLDGRIHTVAGTHVAGDNGDGPAVGTNLQLNFPNGEWVRRDGTVYILDTNNGKVRRVDTNGIMSTLFAVPDGIDSGRGLWVKDDEALVYFASGKSLKRWTLSGGVKTLNNDFTDLGNLAVMPDGNIIATDRAENKVYRVKASGNNAGNRTRIAGDGTTNSVVSGTPALDNGLFGVRGVWGLPTGGYFLATHEGSQVNYVDPAGILYVMVEGAPGNVRSGDGQWVHTPGFKVSEVRSVSVNRQGDILITENDYGYVRKVRFLR